MLLIGRVTFVDTRQSQDPTKQSIYLVGVLDSNGRNVIETAGHDADYIPGDVVVLDVNAKVGTYQGRPELKYWREKQIKRDQLEGYFKSLYGPPAQAAPVAAREPVTANGAGK